MPFLRCSKILGEVCRQEIYNKCSEKSRSPIVFRTDIFQKLTLGAAALMYNRQFIIRFERIPVEFVDPFIRYVGSKL